MDSLTYKNGVLYREVSTVDEDGIEHITYEPLSSPEPTAQEDMEAMLVDHEYRLTLLELGVTE